jgi:hypothetical protein
VLRLMLRTQPRSGNWPGRSCTRVDASLSIAPFKILLVKPPDASVEPPPAPSVHLWADFHQTGLLPICREFSACFSSRFA